MNSSSHGKKAKNQKKLFFASEQKYSCSGCGKCCSRGWDIPLAGAEKSAIEKLNIPGIDFSDTGKRYFETLRRGFFLLGKKADGNTCVFLDDENMCLIHKHCGEKAKPLACRLYPLDVYNWHDGSVSASLRFDCPAAARGEGKKLSQREKEILGFASELEKRDRQASAVYSAVSDPGLEKIRHLALAYKTLLSSEFDPETRLYGAARIVEFHSREINAHDIDEADSSLPGKVMDFISRSRDNLQFTLGTAPLPDLHNRILFRYIISGFARKDEEISCHFLHFGRIGRALSVLRFMLGKGSLSELGSGYPDTSGRDPLDIARSKNFPDRVSQIYWDYAVSKLDSLHFCGTPVFFLSFEEGMRHLLLAYPVLHSFAAFFAEEDKREEVNEEDMQKALMIVDHTFGRSPFFALKHVRKMTRRLCRANVYPTLLRIIK